MSVSLAAQQLVEIVENRRRQGQELGQIHSNQLEHLIVESCNVCFVLVFLVLNRLDDLPVHVHVDMQAVLPPQRL